MKYNLLISWKNRGSNKFYTEQTLLHLMRLNGHEYVDAEEADFILVSMCDITEIGRLKRAREMFLDKKIIIGGHPAVFFKLMVLFADYVVVGQAFEFFRCQTEDEIKNLPCVYYEGKSDVIIPSTFIDWVKVPIIQVAPKTYYYWAGVGCKNMCAFCLTAWTNRPQANSRFRVERAYKEIKEKKKSYLKLIENEGTTTDAYVAERVKDMTLRGFLKTPNPRTKIIRIGLEFATEKNRRKTGKFFTDEEFIRAINKAQEEGVVLQFFCIGGLDTKKQWFDLFDTIPDSIERKPKLIFKFTNLEYNMFTPIYSERYDMDISRFIDKPFIAKLWRSVSGRVRRIKIMPVKDPAHAIWRTGTAASVTREQFDRFWELRAEKDEKVLYKALYETGVIDNDYTDEARFWWSKDKAKKITGREKAQKR